MGIATMALCGIAALVWYVIKYNYHITIARYWELHEEVKARLERNSLYHDVFKSEFRKFLKDTKREKPYQVRHVWSLICVVMAVFLVINYWIEPATLLVKFFNLGGLICTGGYAINGHLAGIEATVVADEKGWKRVNKEMKKNQQALGGAPRAQATSTQSTSTQGTATPSGGAASAPARRSIPLVNRTPKA